MARLNLENTGNRQFAADGKTIRVLEDGRILCTSCNEYLDESSFNKSNKNGWGYCRECAKKLRQEANNKNKKFTH